MTFAASHNALIARKAARTASSRSVAIRLFFSCPANPLLGAIHRAVADAHPGRRFPPVAIGGEGRIGVGSELRDKRGGGGGWDGAQPTGTGLRGERTGGTPLFDIPFGAGETDVVAVGDDGLGTARLDCVDDALAAVGRICFHGLSIAPSL